MYVIIGAGGFLGSELMNSVLNNTNENILAVARNGNVFGRENDRTEIFSGDMESESFLDSLIEKINSYDSTKIIWTVACHNIDFVAENPEKAKRMNVEIPEYVLRQIKNADKIFFTSSDTVYGEGGNTGFSENAELCPVSIYGSQKADAEKVFASYGGVSLRLPLMFSKSKAPSKKHFCDIVCDNLLSGRETTLTTGFLRSALDYGTVADIIIELSKKEALPDTINIAGDDSLSKYDLGLMLAQKLGADKSLLVPVEKWGEFREGAMRTDSTLLDNSLVKNILGIKEIKIKL